MGALLLFGTVMLCVVAHIFFKERLTRRQLFGVGIGALSIMLFNF